MKFSFRLQSVLSWKESLEEESRMKLARKHQRLRKQEEDIRDLADRREENDRGLRKRMEHGLFAREYLIEKQFNEESYQTLAQMAENKKLIEQKVKEERERLTGLMKERKILEKLKEKRFEIFLNELKKLERKNLDEVATRTYRKEGHFIHNTERIPKG